MIIRFQDKEWMLKNTQQLDMHNSKITGKVHSQPEPAIFITVPLELCCWPISKPLLSEALQQVFWQLLSKEFCCHGAPPTKPLHYLCYRKGSTKLGQISGAETDKKALPVQFPTVLQYHSAFRRHAPLLLLKVPHRQNRHPKQKEKKTQPTKQKNPKEAVIFPQQTFSQQQSVCKRYLRQPGSETNSKNEEHFLISK